MAVIRRVARPALLLALSGMAASSSPPPSYAPQPSSSGAGMTDGLEGGDGSPWLAAPSEERLIPFPPAFLPPSPPPAHPFAPPTLTLFAPLRLVGDEAEDGPILGALGTWLRLERDNGGAGGGGGSPAWPPPAQQQEELRINHHQHWPFMEGDGLIRPPVTDIIFIAEDGGRQTCNALRRLMPVQGGGGDGGGRRGTVLSAPPPGPDAPPVPRVRCVDACLHACYARPNMTCLVDTAVRLARTPVLALVNSDIALGPDFVRAVHHLFQPARPGPAPGADPVGPGQVSGAVPPRAGQAAVDNVIAVGRRIDVPLDGSARRSLDFADPAWRARLHARATTHGIMHSEYGVDYMVAAAPLWAAAAGGRGPLAMPPFVAGAFRWDSFVLSQAVVHPGVAVVDMTPAVTAMHLQAGASGPAPSTHSRRAGAAHNERLARSLTGDRYLMGKTTLANYELVAVAGGGGGGDGDGDQFVLLPRVN